MNLFPKKSLEYSIILKLQKQSWVIVELIDELRKTRTKLTKQAVYQALRRLRKSEIVITASKKASLSSVWIDRMYDFFSVAKNIYEGAPAVPGVYQENFVSLEDGDQITYIFKNPQNTDIFWGHASNILRGLMPSGEPLFIYTPHEWSMLAREQTEKDLMRNGTEDGHPWYVYIPYKDPLDEFTKPMFTTPNLAHTEAKHYFKENFYINTHGDYLIEVTLDPKTQKSIDDFYKTYSVWDAAAKARLNFIVSHMKGKNKLTISRNAKKASKYKQLFKKYFPMPV
jgi:hypothetical protein